MRHKQQSSIQLGLLGKKLTHSFSKNYFSKKFKEEQLLHFTYQNFEIERISDFCDIWDKYPNLLGMNITIPYKELVLDYLDEIDSEAEKVGAVNTIVREDGRLKGFNTDVVGFETSLNEFISGHSEPGIKALVLGTGGAAKAVAYVLTKQKIEFKFVSRNPSGGQMNYADIDDECLSNYHLIVNTTPLGMVPNCDQKPTLPYFLMTSDHYLFDLIYNPEKSLFLQEGEKAGAQIKNGHQMLIIQAEKSWEIWNSYLN